MAKPKKKKPAKKKPTGKVRSKKPITFMGLTSRALMIIAASLLVVSYFTFAFNPVKVWVVSLFGIAFLPLFLLNLFLLIWAILRRSRAVMIPLLALIPSLFFIGRYVQVNPAKDFDAPGPDTKIVSYNVGRFAPPKKSRIDDRRECLDSVAAFLRGTDADVICLQEFYLPYPEDPKTILASEFPGYKTSYYLYTSKSGYYGNVILSRYPIRDKGFVKFDNSTNLAVFTDLEIGERTVRVYDCHFESYNISPSGVIKSLRNGSDVLEETGRKMRSGIRRRPVQVDQVISNIASSPVESLVCGDFNDSPLSYTYFKLRQQRRDSFADAGRGFGATYSVLWPLLRIDYVLAPKFMQAYSHRTPHVRYSDHYPVIVSLCQQ